MSTDTFAVSTQGAPPPEKMQTRSRVGAVLVKWRFASVLLLLIPLVVFFSVTQPTFGTSSNLQNLLTGASITWIAAMGMTFVMLSGGFDLSLGSLFALSGLFLVWLYNDVGLDSLLAILLTIAFAAAVGGVVNGMLIGKLGLSFLVVTLGTMAVLRGIVNVWSDGATEPVDSALFSSIGFDSIILPIPVLLMIGTYLLSLFVLRKTYFGRDVYAVGGNPDAARLSGINVNRTIVLVYAIAGITVAVAAVVQVGRIQAASPIVGDTLPLDAATAVLLGGTSFKGGIGSVTGTVVGVLFLAVLQNGLALAGVQSYWSQIVSGSVLVGAIAADRLPDLRRAIMKRRRAGAGGVR